MTDEKRFTEDDPVEAKPVDERVAVRLTPPVALVRERDKLLKADSVAEVTSPAQYVAVVEDLRRLKAAEKQFTEAFLETRRPLREAATRSINLEKLFLQPMRDRIAVQEAAVATWRRAQEAREAELRAQARAEAERKAREERQTMLEALEAARKATASRIEKKALKDQATALAAAPVAAASAAIVSTVPKVAGVFDREDWTAEVTDFEALVLAVAVPVLLKRVDLRLTIERSADDGLSAEMIRLTNVRDWLAAQTTGVAAVEAIVPNKTYLDAVAVRCRADVPIPGVEGRRRVTTVVRASRE